MKMKRFNTKKKSADLWFLKQVPEYLLVPFNSKFAINEVNERQVKHKLWKELLYHYAFVQLHLWVKIPQVSTSLISDVSRSLSSYIQVVKLEKGAEKQIPAKLVKRSQVWR